jgi:hypothetical protein
MTHNVASDHVEPRGLFGGFEGHRVPADVVANTAISSALISLDANVLLGLYRYPDDFASELLDAFWALRTNIFVSDQASPTVHGHGFRRRAASRGHRTSKPTEEHTIARRRTGRSRPPGVWRGARGFRRSITPSLQASSHTPIVTACVNGGRA